MATEGQIEMARGAATEATAVAATAKATATFIKTVPEDFEAVSIVT